MYGYGMGVSSVNRLFSGGGGGGGYTARTTAFATETGIVDATILNALNTLDQGLIDNSLDSKMIALYPFVGGTASTHKYNFFDPRDLDVAFRLNFHGGWTHSATGIQGNGSTYANTFLIPSTSLSLNNTHASIYSRTNNTRNTFDILDPEFKLLIGLNFSGTEYMRVNQLTYSTKAATNSLGLGLINREISTTEKLYRDGTLTLTSARNSTSLSSSTLRIGGQSGAGVLYTNREYAFASIGQGMTDAQVTTFYNLVQDFQTSLSRQV